MNIGKLRHRVDILQRTVTVEDGISNEEWNAACIVWSSVEPLVGREYFVAAAAEEEDTVKFRMRYGGNLSPEENRLAYGGKQYDIYSIHCPEERKAELIVMGKLTREKIDEL